MFDPAYIALPIRHSSYVHRVTLEVAVSFSVNDRKYVFHFRPKPKPKPEKHLALGRIPKPKLKVQIYLKIGGILLKFNVSND